MKPPRDWKAATVADICEMRNGHGFGPSDWDTEGLPIIRIQNLNGGKKFDYYSGVPEQRWLVEQGQLLFAWAGTRGVSFGPTVWSGPLGVLNQHIFKIEPVEGIDRKWLYWALRHATDRIEAQAHGFKATLVHVKKSDIDRQLVAIPPKDEQHRIACMLATWDRAIEISERLLANSRKQKRALMQRLLSPSANTETPWRIFRLGELFIERNENSRSDLPLLSITRDEGVISRDDVGRKDTSNEDKSKYLRICFGDIGYNTMRMWQGVSALSSMEGIVSPAYTIVTPNERIDARFAAYLFKLEKVVFLFYRNSQGLVSDTWNLKFPYFAKISVSIPDINEQKRTVQLLETADKSISVLTMHLEKLRQEKTALMAQLLTGKRRVHLHTPELALAA